MLLQVGTVMCKKLLDRVVFCCVCWAVTVCFSLHLTPPWRFHIIHRHKVDGFTFVPSHGIYPAAIVFILVERWEARSLQKSHRWCLATPGLHYNRFKRRQRRTAISSLFSRPACVVLMNQRVLVNLGRSEHVAHSETDRSGMSLPDTPEMVVVRNMWCARVWVPCIRMYSQYIFSLFGTSQPIINCEGVEVSRCWGKTYTTSGGSGDGMRETQFWDFTGTWIPHICRYW